MDLVTPVNEMDRGVKVWVYSVLFDDGTKWVDSNADIDGHRAACFYKFVIY